jgi:hypothetical protein
LLDLVTATPNRRPAQAGNLAEASQATASRLQGQQAHKTTPALLVEYAQDPIDRTMIFGDRALGMVATSRTSAFVNGRFLLGFHMLVPIGELKAQKM